MIEQTTPEGFRACTLASSGRGGTSGMVTGRVYEATRNGAGRLIWVEVAEYLPLRWQTMTEADIRRRLYDTAPYELRLGIARGGECE